MPLQAHLDQEALRELQGVLGDDFPVLVRTFLADSDARMSALRVAAVTGDARALRETAHSFKGSSLNIGARHLAALCYDVEQCARADDLAAAMALLTEVDAELKLVATLLAVDPRSH
ncbi:MAG: Hpt domain-containing protein [Pseudomonadota bacterium]